MRLRFILPLLLLLTPLVLRAQREKLPPDDLAWVEKNFPNAKKSNTGIRYVEIEHGTGEPAHRGDLVSVLYVGRLIDGKTFDQNSDKDKPFKFRVGRNLVIQGWDQILQLMRVGDKWLIVIPPELGYGTRGSPPQIPGDSTLVFTIQLLAIDRE
jgi:FKBP-type peptidyl-prolyl cis-trans isomerase